MTKRQTMVTTAFALAILALCFLLSRQVWFRLDVTRDGINTISRVSRDLHLEIAEQAQITYFISERLRAMHPLPGEVEDFLREYVGFSRGRMRLSVVDPARAGMSAEVESLGIAPWQIPMMEQGSASILTVYSGITIEYLGDIAVMPLVVSLETLEYDLTSRIRALARGAPRAAGILLTDPRAWEENFRHLSAALEQAGYRTVFVAPGAEIPAGLSALIVIDGVETLDDLALFQIDRFIRGGGSALFAARAVGVDARGGMEARALYDRGLLAMLASYGAILSPEIVMDEAALVMRFQEIADDGSAQIRSAPNFQWIRAMPEYASLAHPLGAGFAGLDLYWANPITLAPPYGIRAEPLFTTTPAAWTMREPFFASPELAYMMERDAPQTALGRRILGASLAGIFPSWFEDRPLPDGAQGLEAVEARPARIVVIGETEFASSFLFVTDALHNLNFVVQAVDWLGNDDDIVAIRARAPGLGRLDRIADPASRDAAMRFARAINVFVVPILVIIAGAFFSFRRKALARLRSGERESDGEGAP